MKSEKGLSPSVAVRQERRRSPPRTSPWHRHEASQKVFFDGQIYDAFEQMKKFVRMAKAELIVIDPYFDDSVLPLIAQKSAGVSVLVVKNTRKSLADIVAPA